MGYSTLRVFFIRPALVPALNMSCLGPALNTLCFGPHPTHILAPRVCWVLATVFNCLKDRSERVFGSTRDLLYVFLLFVACQV